MPTRCTTLFLQCLASLFESGNRLLSLHTWKIIEEVVERMPGCVIIHERLQGHPRPDEHGRAAENLWISVDYATRQCLWLR
jgi:hypothetical protein